MKDGSWEVTIQGHGDQEDMEEILQELEIISNRRFWISHSNSSLRVPPKDRTIFHHPV